MKIGDLIRFTSESWGTPLEDRIVGIVIADHSPQRPEHVGRIIDVMWANGEIEDMYTRELEVIDETR